MESLERLGLLIQDNESRCIFNKPALESEIKAFEKKFKLQLPVSYKKFLLNYNGGFIYKDNINTLDPDIIANCGYNSNYFLSLGEIEKEYEDMQLIHQEDHGFNGAWLFIPFMRTNGQEFVVFKNPLEHGESKVYDAFHEYMPDEWGVMYKDFNELLEAFIENEGEIALIGKCN